MRRQFPTTELNCESVMLHQVSHAEELQEKSIKLASPIILALKECDDELRTVAFELFEQLAGGDLDKEQEQSTLALLAEILFPKDGPYTRVGTDELPG